MIYKIKFVGTQNFTDGNIFPDTKKQGDIIEVDEVTYTQVVQSGGQVEVLEKRVPPSSVLKFPDPLVGMKTASDLEIVDDIHEEEKPKTVVTKRARNSKGHFIKAKE